MMEYLTSIKIHLSPNKIVFFQNIQIDCVGSQINDKYSIHSNVAYEVAFYLHAASFLISPSLVESSVDQLYRPTKDEETITVNPL